MVHGKRSVNTREERKGRGEMGGGVAFSVFSLLSLTSLIQFRSLVALMRKLLNLLLPSLPGTVYI